MNHIMRYEIICPTFFAPRSALCPILVPLSVTGWVQIPAGDGGADPAAQGEEESKGKSKPVPPSRPL
jgi:hypothetical protein